MIQSKQLYLQYKAAGREATDPKEEHQVKQYVRSLPDDINSLLTCDRILTIQDFSHDALYDLYLDYLKVLQPQLIIDDANSPAIKSIIQYLRHDPEFLDSDRRSFAKGLMLRGGVGTGKSLLMRGLCDLLKGLYFFRIVEKRYSATGINTNLEKGIEVTHTIAPAFITSAEIVRDFCIGGFKIFDRAMIRQGDNFVSLKCGYWIFDDIGAESSGFHYGARVNVISELLTARYDEYTLNRAANLTHATSNLNPEDIKKTYGDRIYDRMKEMFNDIILHGQSRRK